MIEYLTGPKMVEWQPMQNRASSSSGTDWNHRPASPSAMKPISAPLTARISQALSHASASSPASAEKRK